MNRRMVSAWPVAALLAAAARGGPPVADLEHGAVAPPIRATTIEDERIDTAARDGPVLIVLFGATGQAKTDQACRLVAAALEPIAARREPHRWLLVLSRSSAPADLEPVLGELPCRPSVVHDESREIFGAFRTVVVPTAVVIDREGRVVHRQAAMSNRFGDIIADALAVALGHMSYERFEQSLHAPADDAQDAASAQRADRLVQFGRRLAEEGRDALAEEKFRQAIDLDPAAPAPRLALGEFLLDRSRLDEAGAWFRSVPEGRRESIDARLGLARVCAAQSPPDLEEAEQLVRAVLEGMPDLARAHYAMGLIHERRGDAIAAAASYRRAAELLMRQAASLSSTDQTDVDER